VQINANWGIKPDWANRLLINAQSETVASKKTFKNAFLSNRCIVPLSGWYEWKTNESGAKQKYLFSNSDNAMFMAGIIYNNQEVSKSNPMVDLFGEPISGDLPERQVVTLTTKALGRCADIHSRMPLLIPNTEIDLWLSGTSEEATSLLQPVEQEFLVTTNDIKASKSH